MLKINIQTIPHDDQRYETCGDWWYDDDDVLQIRVSDLGDWRYEALVAVHELVECVLCKHAGVKQEQVDEFDIQYELMRSKGYHEPEDEPGDDPKAPYSYQHCVATGVERILATLLGVTWKVYESAIEAL